MGFFSSRKSEPGPIPRHDRDKSRDGQSVSGSPVAVIKSKWYSKSRTKTAPEPSRQDDSMETEVTMRFDAYRRTATGSEAESSRAHTDAVTKTMAERLNELTKSHAEGMIDDETYRDLRASLFERFGAASHSPSEQAHIRLSGDPTLHAHPTITSSKRHSIGRPDSNFHLAPRPPSMSLSRPQTPSGAAHSIRSTTSRASTVATAVTGLLRRGAKNRHADQQSTGGSRPGSPDNASMFSATSSSVPQYYPRAYPGSTHSLASVGGARAPSLSSRRTGRSGLTSRTFATPPSSYHRHGYAYTATGASSSTGMDTDVRSKTESEMSMSADLSEYDDKSPQELREAMIRTEREGRKLLDAFNGLELTILTKYRGTGGAMGMAGVGGVGPVTGWTHVNPSGEFGERRSMSMRRRPSQMKGKGSSSSLYTAPVPGPPPTQLHPNKARSLSLSVQNGGSTSSLRSRSPQPATVQEEGFVDDPEMAQLHKEMEDIRRRRAQVASRYETRLEMLRVKLKSAELRDKVAR
ncbi:hypothetical protein RhiLY_05540 [Ceratobasidium sp. AG-Ba]|nr:hypothetical protein RhiLY_05540 [Ceratobasidium sp. AG-Ba]